MWYEICGSAHQHTETQRQYVVTYKKHRSSGDSIAWTDNRGNNGYIVKNSFRTQNYFPDWATDDSLVFVGTRLPNNAVEQAPNYFVRNAFEYGYADNQPNATDSGIDIAWATDTAGNPVVLQGIDFVKVYTGVFQNNGNIGECSTEIAGAIDLHCNTAVPHATRDEIQITINNRHISIATPKACDIVLYDIAGRIVAHRHTALYQTTLPSGIYIVKAGQTCRKIAL